MSRWVDFVKEWAKKNNISYGCALSNADMKAEYYKMYPKKVKKGDKKFDASNVNVIDLEEAIPSAEPKSKNITIKKPKKESIWNRRDKDKLFDILKIDNPKLTYNQLDNIVGDYRLGTGYFGALLAKLEHFNDNYTMDFINKIGNMIYDGFIKKQYPNLPYYYRNEGFDEPNARIKKYQTELNRFFKNTKDYSSRIREFGKKYENTPDYNKGNIAYPHYKIDAKNLK